MAPNSVPFGILIGRLMISPFSHARSMPPGGSGSASGSTSVRRALPGQDEQQLRPGGNCSAWDHAI